MKKTLLSLLLVLVLTATCFATLAACDSNDNGKNIGALKTEKKYLEESTVNSTLTEHTNNTICFTLTERANMFTTA